MGLSDDSAAKTQCSTPEGDFRVWRVESPVRLEIFLRKCLPDASIGSLRRVLGRGGCLVDGVARPWGYQLAAGAEVRLDPEARISEVTPEAIPLEILFEDDELIAVNKRPGMLVHPTTQVRTGTVANALRGAGYDEIHFLHRLDRETSGVLLVAKRLAPGSALARMFEERNVEKRYLAVVDGPVEWDERTVMLPVGRDETRQPYWDVQPGGAEAETRLRVLARREGSVLLEANPVTGRTNQIRIHCAAIGHPLIGDPAYGGRAAERLGLHAWQLEFAVAGGPRRVLVAPPPLFFTTNG